MSNETDLDWLARNVHEWNFFVDALADVNNGNVKWQDPNLPRETGFIDRQQWLVRRAELQNKPRWNDHPDAKWLSQDEDGVWYWHAVEPSPKGKTVSGEGYWLSNGESSIACRGGLIGDWRDTLDRRPECVRAEMEVELVKAAFKPFTSIEDNQELNVSSKKEMKQDNGWFERGELPPVGVECEILWNDAEWHKTKILAHLHIDKFNVCPVFTTEWDDIAFVDCMPHYKSFRPIRTEREMAIEEMCREVGLQVSVFGFEAGKLYDAGYRKKSK